MLSFIDFDFFFFFFQISKPLSFGPGWESNSQPPDLWQTPKPSCLGARQEDHCLPKVLI